MQKGKPEVQDVTTDSDNWNVAEGYVKLKVLKPLVLLDKFETIAFFGTDDPEEARFLDNNEISRRRVDGLNRYYHYLLQILGNTYFAIKKKDHQMVGIYKQRAENCYPYIGKCYRNIEDVQTHEKNVVIDEERFKRIYDILKNIKDDVNIIFNNAHLIFRQSEEIDLEQIMNDVIEGG